MPEIRHSISMMKRYGKYIAIGVAVILLALAGRLVYPLTVQKDAGQKPGLLATLAATATAIPTPAPTVRVEAAQTEVPKLMHVDIEGNVALPGEYFAYPGDTVADIIERAGGLLPGANTGKVDLDKQVMEGDFIYIP